MIGRISVGDWTLFALTALYLVPIWTNDRLATQDGPSHVYNAYVLSQLMGTADSSISQVFTVRWDPVPNWLGHALLTLLIWPGLPPLVAEKVLVSLYILGIAASSRFLLRGIAPGQEIWSPLALPLAYSFSFFMGFYNFLCGIPLALWTLGLAWRWRNSLGLLRAMILAGLLEALFLTHLVTYAIGVVSLTLILLSSAKRPWSMVLTLGGIFLPSLLLLQWYVTESDPSYLDKMPLWKVVAESNDRPSKLIDRFCAAVLSPTPHHQRTAALGCLGIILLVPLVSTVQALRQGALKAVAEFWERKGAFFLASSQLLALALLFPHSWGHHGGYYTERLVVFAAFLALACLPTPMTERSKRALLALTAAISLINLIPVSVALHNGDVKLRQLLADLPQPAQGTRVLPLLFHARPRDEVRLLEHITAYLCLHKGVVNWDNYEARGFCFPLMFKPGIAYPDLDRMTVEGYIGAEIDFSTVDLVLAGPNCPKELVDRIGLTFPHMRGSGALRSYWRNP